MFVANARWVLDCVDGIFSADHNAPGTKLVAVLQVSSSDRKLLVVLEPVAESNVSQAAPPNAVDMFNWVEG